MHRRSFLTLLGTSAAAWPQQSRAIPAVGWLRAGTLSNTNWVAALHQGLNDLGYVDGRNVRVELRNSDQYEQLPNLASALVRRQVAVIFADAVPAAVAA